MLISLFIEIRKVGTLRIYRCIQAKQSVSYSILYTETKQSGATMLMNGNLRE